MGKDLSWRRLNPYAEEQPVQLLAPSTSGCSAGTLLDPNTLLADSNSLCYPAAAVPASTLCTHLDASADVIHDLDCPAVLVAREGLGESGDLHLPFGLNTGFLSIDGFTRGALQTPILWGERSRHQGSTAKSPGHRGPGGDGPARYLVPVGVHGQHAEHVEGVLAICQTTNGLWLDCAALTCVAIT